jgi:hypothetical protein
MLARVLRDPPVGRHQVQIFRNRLSNQRSIKGILRNWPKILNGRDMLGSEAERL